MPSVKNTGLVVFLALLVAGCASSGSNVADSGSSEAARVSTADAPAGGSHGERTFQSPTAHLAGYTAVLVTTPIIKTTSERNEKVDDFLSQMEGTIRASLTQALEASGRFKEVTSRPEVAQAAGRHLVCKSEAMVHFGSTAARILIGMGAGRSKLIVVHSLEDPQTGDIVLKYTGWGGAIAGYGFQILGKMQADGVAIAQYYGNLVRGLPE